ncbi:MAG: transposase [Deltaproteobacteria bacterium]|nr:transposase [Deltaproteobacteria bacterium]
MDILDLIGQGQVKRYFRATRKLCTPNLVSHITQRAAGKEPLFLEDADYLFMLGLIKEISHQFSLQMYAFCLMQNHIHLLLRPREDNLYDAMRNLFSRYAMKFNRKYERRGHLFGGPYRQSVCMDDRYLLAASLYIHLNPVKAGLAKSPEAYRWSSCRLYYKDNAPKSFVDPDFILSLLSGDKSNRKVQYRLLLKKGREVEVDRVLEKKDAIERFQSKLAAIFPALFRHVDKKRQIAITSGIEIPEMAELEKAIKSLRKGNLHSKPESRKAKKYLVEQLMARGYKREEIAERLGISRKTIYNILKSPPGENFRN